MPGPATTSSRGRGGGGGGGGTLVQETPSGTIDGVNAVFVYSQVPVTLFQYKNGVFQRPGAGNDYTRSGATVTFLAGNIPQVGDSVYGFYSITSTPAFTEGTPAGTIDGVNTVFTLAGTPTQVLWLFKNGVEQRPGAGNDYTRSGATLTFLAGNVPQPGDSLYAIFL